MSQQKQYLQFDYHSFLPAQLRRSILQMLSFYQDRLGTNIATALTKRRAADCTEQLGADGASYLWCAKHNTTQHKTKQSNTKTKRHLYLFSPASPLYVAHAASFLVKAGDKLRLSYIVFNNATKPPQQ